ncbi:hypothetical protein GCM10025857_40050 [Alicyclobacillus contaminans]|uniref:hypothetical protein n=1 Tax=Alicyclobacillus contaminans TaxID=392016 RepID=UPI000408CFFD|nr:hypothetical protein [Alicyclobacillus contaminans]GMA52589.1 hypothetical protein GCM10025857_39460 [Alicyclobacillus contaminans]GMA52648.1 hypothetical protein GCM10025857_40050 [Alicyclobacillus contaminans]
MPKVTLSFVETLRYTRKVQVRIPPGMTESQLETALGAAERSSDSVESFLRELKDWGVKAIEPVDDDLSSPDDQEVECDDYEFED